ncbi:MAG: peptidase S9, partial [Actinomycetota bacterium]|nr:peptidase S9 [Actinomycetota bacterium]
MRVLISALGAALLAASLAPAAHAEEPPAAQTANITSSSIPVAMTREYNGSNLRIRRTLSKNSAYTRYKATYTSGDLKICGILIEPKGAGPFPMVVLAHGY